VNRIRLWGSPVSGQPKKDCDYCKENRVPEGGVQMGKRWMCAKCWGKRKAHK
jgi:formylmethanofuran dehydrogenase subunit E